MKIGIMCHSGVGGSVRIATKLAVALAHMGHTAHLFTRTRPPFGWGRHDNVTLHLLKIRANLNTPSMLDVDWPKEELQDMADSVVWVVVKHGLDILHFHYCLPFALVAQEIKCRLGARAPYIIGTIHGTEVSLCRFDSVKRQQLSEALAYTDALTSVSVAHAHLAAQVLSISTLPIVIYDFVSQSEFREQSIEQRNLENRSKLRIAHVSNFRPVKNAESLANVFIGIRKQIDSELWLIGDGEELAVVKSLLRQKGFENDVRCWGLKCQVTAILDQTDMLLVTSHYESFCLAALEAMACEVPVVAPWVGGIPEVVVHGRTGFLYEQGDLSAAVEYSVAMLSDANHRQSIGKAALDQARRFSQDKIVPEYEALYKRLFYNRESSSSHG